MKNTFSTFLILVFGLISFRSNAQCNFFLPDPPNFNRVGKVTKSCTVGDENGSEETTAEELNIYPNPTTGIFVIDLNLSSDETEQVTIQVYNSMGQSVQQENTTSTNGIVKKEIHLAPETPWGLYLVRIIGGDELVAQPLVIQK